MTTTTSITPRSQEPSPVPGPQARTHRRHLATWTQKDWYLAALVALAITALGAATDAIFAADVLRLLVGVTFLAYLAAVGAVTVASACAFFAGHVIHHGANKRWGWTLVGVWALIGLGLAVMRMVHSQIKIPDIPDGATSEEIDRIMRNALLSDLGLGVIMLVIFLATGVLLIHKAKDLADPDLRRMLKGLNKRTRLLKHWSNAATQSVLQGNLLARRNHHIGISLSQERVNAHAGVTAIGALNKEASRLTQVEIIGHPSATLMPLLPHPETPTSGPMNTSPADQSRTANHDTDDTKPDAPAPQEDTK